MLADLGLARTPHPDHAAYLASWLPLLTADPRALATAAAAGSRAADFLAALQPPDNATRAAGQHNGQHNPATPNFITDQRQAGATPTAVHSTAASVA